MKIITVNFGQNFNSNTVNYKQSSQVAFTHPVSNPADDIGIEVNRRGIIRFIESQIQKIAEKISNAVID